MRGLHRNAVAALNEQINATKNESQDNDVSTYVSIYHFGNDVQCLLANQHVFAVQNIIPSQIRVAGATALMDAVGMAADDLQSVPIAADEDVSYLIIAFTDGQENISRHFTVSSFKAMTRERNATDMWTFIMSGPRHCHADFERLGILPGNIQEWEQTEAGVERMSASVQTGLARYYSGRQKGVRSTAEFFQPDLSRVRTTDVQRLDNLSGNFAKLPVNNATPDGKEWQIRPFVEDRLGRNATLRRQYGLSYKPGTAFYQITKPETIQSYKQILIREKTSGAVYGGSQARQLIGMPFGS
jgi:uncharacterized protein YegL